MRRPEKKGMTEKSPQGESGRPGAKTEETKAPGHK